MPVELVASVQSHSIQELLDKFNAEEMTTAIQQHTTIREAGLVGNLHVGEFYALAFYYRQALTQRFGGTEKTCRFVGTDEDALLAHSQCIAFLLLFCKFYGLFAFLALLGRSNERQADGSLLVGCCQLQLNTCCLLYPFL